MFGWALIRKRRLRHNIPRLHGKMGQSAPPPLPPPVLNRGHIIGAYTYISVHTKGHIDDFIDRQGLGGFFCWGGGGLGWITGEGASGEWRQTHF